jgi:hypothetical protein
MTGTDQTQSPVPFRCGIVPPYLLARLAEVDDPRFTSAAEAARRSLRVDDPIRSLRLGERRSTALPTQPVQAVPGVSARTISDAGHLQQLPGRVVRVEGQPPVGDVSVNEAYAGLGDTHELYWSQYLRNSIDGRGLPLGCHRALRAGVRQRVLGRRAHGVRRR